MVKPYLSRMSDSQFFAVMSCGLASVAGGTLVGYASIGVELKISDRRRFHVGPAGSPWPRSWCRPVPRGGSSRGRGDPPRHQRDRSGRRWRHGGPQHRCCGGATLLAFVGVIALLNGLLGWAGDLVGLD